MHEYKDRCQSIAAQNSEFRFCPDCAGLLSEFGHCSVCVQPVIEIKQGIRLREGARCTVPIRLTNKGTKPFGVVSATYKIIGEPKSSAIEDWDGLSLGAGNQAESFLSFPFESVGEYALQFDVVLSWRLTQHLHYRFTTGPAITALPRGSIIQQSGGTDTMNYLSGDAVKTLIEYQSDISAKAIAGRHRQSL